MLEEENLQKGFAYFGITDEAYRTDVLACAAEVRRTPAMLQLFTNSREAIYGGACIRRDKLSPLASFLAEGRAPSCFSALLLLTAWDELAKNRVTYHLTDYDVEFARQRVRKAPYNCWRKGTGNLYFELLLWIADFLNGNEPHCGSLIFQRYSDRLVEVHIPSKADLSPDMVRQSLRMAPSMLLWCYGLERYEIRCESWLLSPELQAICKAGSNIAQFANFFDIAPGADCTEDIFRNLYKNHPNDLTTLPETTSLQRAAKACLLQGGTFRLGIGTVKAQYT